jgi:hypothetical protein
MGGLAQKFYSFIDYSILSLTFLLNRVIFNSMIIEIRAGEGGADAKDLCLVQTDIYSKLAKRGSL